MIRKFSSIVALLLVTVSLGGFASPASSLAEEGGNPWWIWLLIILALVAFVAFVIWWWRGSREEEAEAPAAESAVARSAAIAEPVAEEAAEEEPPAPPPAPAEPDDLKRIEGIGPKISGVLNAAGITTFAQLADASAGQIEQILEAADPNLLRLAKPATWPEQARLAAGGLWEELETLQDELHGGQRR
jgi:predicted flap endonuclease-1-like 5' DNA nuclease